MTKTFEELRSELRHFEERINELSEEQLDELYEEQLNERLLRKGAGIGFAVQSKAYGDRATRSFRAARGRFRLNPSASPDENVKTLSAGLSDLCVGLEELRNQNGAITSLVLTGVLLSEKK